MENALCTAFSRNGGTIFMPEKENAPSTEVNPTLFLKTKKKKSN